ncbi:MAG: efflux RND transporter periplasmic adaptor subunit [Armatimonadota bacterium]
MRRAVLFTLILVTAASFSGCKPKTKAKAKTTIPVRTAIARTGSIADTVEVSGDIKALKSAVLSAKMSGRVTAVPYREGDLVGVGTVVVRQDTSDLAAQVREAEAALQAARARLSQARTSAQVSDTQTEAGVSSAQAALEAAQARLRMVKSGARRQEVASAQNAVAVAQASFQNSKSNYDRMKGLYDQGALSAQQMDLVQMQHDVAKAQLSTAKEQLSLVKAGARDEEVEAAEKQVRQAEEGLRVAKSNRAQRSLRSEDIKSAQAGVSQAEAALAYARQQQANAYVRSPLAGTVASRLTEPGEMASPGTPLIEVVALNTVYFEAGVSEIEVARVKVGQSVQVTVDALSKKFRGTVEKILPTADAKSRQFKVQIKVENKAGELRPGMFARGSIEVARHKDAVIAPKDALIQGGEAVYAVVGGKAVLRRVTTGFTTDEEAEVLSGVAPGDELVTVGQDRLSDGVKIDAVN